MEVATTATPLNWLKPVLTIIFQLKFAVGDLFDIQITDADIDNEIIRDAIMLFTAWKDRPYIDRTKVLKTQKLSKWRPKNDNIAIISSKRDLQKLTEGLSATKNFIVLFNFENVLRLKLI